MNTSTQLRPASQADYDTLSDVMFDAVRHGHSEYSEDQRRAWMPCPPEGDVWSSRLRAQTVWVAIRSQQIVGFMSLDIDGWIDLAFVRPASQGTGVFRCLFESIEHQARQSHLRWLRVYASRMARPAFAKMGFQVVQEQTIQLADQWLDRFEMQKISQMAATGVMVSRKRRSLRLLRSVGPAREPHD